MRSWLAARLEDLTDSEAWRRVATDKRPRDLARAIVGGAQGQPPLRLSVAIEGGSSRVKRGHPEEWLLSDHGRWRQMHLGALDAAYGSTPFFRYFIPEIEDAFNSVNAGDSFSQFTSRLFHSTIGKIIDQDVIDSLRRLRSEQRDFYQKLTEEKKEEEIDDLAFIDVIFRKGPEAIFSIT